ncbi:MAG: DUF3102 domain-containing protein [Desulfobulbaceae bacterium]|nr:DUF3102 domain-containing protein [Desulfobulbaceae bacterium]
MKGNDNKKLVSKDPERHGKTGERKAQGTEIKEKGTYDTKILTQQEQKVVDEAFSHIQKIYIQHFQNSIIEIGNYLVDTFFAGDLTRAKKKKPLPKYERSFYALCKKLKEHDARLPSKSWLYNAVNVLVLDDELGDKGFQTCGNLTISHKVILLTAPDSEKMRLAEKADKEKYSVRELKKEIDKTRNRNKPKRDEKDRYLSHLESLKKDLEKRKAKVTATRVKIPSYEKLKNAFNDFLKKIDEMIDEEKKVE